MNTYSPAAHPSDTHAHWRNDQPISQPRDQWNRSAKPFLSVIIPAYNEAQRIGKTLRTVHQFLSAQSYPYEVIVVDDGSIDETRKLVRTLASEISHLSVLENDANHGKGFAVRQGMLAASGRYRLFMDSDGSTSIEHVDLLLPHAMQGCDIVMGSRRISGAILQVPQAPLRHFLGATFRALVHTLIPLGIADSQNGFKLFSSRAAQQLFTRQRTVTWAFDVELLAIARRMGFSVKEVGIRWINDGRSKVTLMGMVMMLVEVLHIRMNLWRDLYDDAPDELQASWTK